MDKAALRRVICERLAEGESLRAICSDQDMPNRATVAEWISGNVDGFGDMYARAKAVGLDVMADGLVDIADDGRNDWMERNGGDCPGWQLNGEHVQRSKLRVDARKWYLAKLAPKKYGERTVIAGDADAPLVTKVDVSGATPEQLRALAGFKLPNEGE